MITYLSGIILIVAAYYIGQYKGYVKAKSFFQHQDETQKVSTNEQAKEFCRHCGSLKTYDVFFSKWFCPVCDNVRQNG